MQSNKKKLVIVDLDGTLYSINTFEAWVFYYLKWSFERFHLSLFFSLLLIGFLRKIRVISHEMLKRKIIAWSVGADAALINCFVAGIQKYRNKTVVEAFSALQADVVVLATAAPSFYLSALVKDLAFDECIATNSILTNDWRECRGEEKLSRVELAVDLRQFDQIVFFTDHEEDLPLMKRSSSVVLVNPAEKTQNKIAPENLNYSVLFSG